MKIHEGDGPESPAAATAAVGSVDSYLVTQPSSSFQVVAEELFAILRRRNAVSNVVIRSAALTDFAAIARLVSELGYPTSPSQMQLRLEAILEDHDYFTLVACDGEQVVGFVGTRVGPLYEADRRYGQIMALAVAATHHRRGVGQMLMQAAESNLVERGARELVVTSGNHRAGAHAFYESCGYTFTGRRYRKSLG